MALNEFIESEKGILDDLLKTVSPAELMEYRNETLLYSPARFIARVDNARDWVNVDSFALWLAHRTQSKSTPQTPSRYRTPSAHSTPNHQRNLPANKSIISASIPSTPLRLRQRSTSVLSCASSVAETVDESFSESETHNTCDLSPFPEINFVEPSPSPPPPPAQPQLSTRVHAHGLGRAPTATVAARHKTEPEVIEISSDSEDEQPVMKLTTTVVKREPSPEVQVLDCLPAAFTKRKRQVSGTTSMGESVAREERRPLKQVKIEPGLITHQTGTGSVRITRQRKVSKLITLTYPPQCWSIPHPGENYGYLLDLSQSTQSWTRNGHRMTMAAIIKAEDQDAWGDGTAGGSEKNTVMVHAFGPNPIKCRRAQHTCQGVYHCNQLDPSILDGCERYEPSLQEQQDLLTKERTLNIDQGSSSETQAGTFYNIVQTRRRQCPWKSADGQPCSGLPVYRKYSKGMNNDGKLGFIGCSQWGVHQTNRRDHRFIPIPINVHEDLVIELFRTNGSFKHMSCDSTVVGQCAHIVPPRKGGKGSKECPYTHIIDSKPVVGKMVKLTPSCRAQIDIYEPVDENDRRAIVLLKNAHSHPTPQYTKVSIEAQERYKKAVIAAGVMGATVGRVERALTTQDVFDGVRPAEFSQGLNSTRIKYDLLRSVKAEKMPHGQDLLGVVHHMELEAKSASCERYIQVIATDGQPVIVTFLPSLVKWIHSANATSHDNTYKRIMGDWKEWEIAAWIEALNMRVTIGRVYCKKEDRASFYRMWSLFFEAVQKSTGHQVEFKAFSGTGLGLRAIILDTCKAQIDALGDYLIKYNNPTVSGISETDPLRMVEYIVKLCGVHFDRGVTKLEGKQVSKEALTHIRAVPHMKTQDELDAFKTYCDTSTEKAVRDWYADKKASDWYFPCINGHYSKMSLEDWTSTPNSSNITESAHVETNRHTGTRLSLLEGIDSAHQFDKLMEDKVRIAQKTGVLPNHLNTEKHRMNKNLGRAIKRSKVAMENQRAGVKLNDLDTQLADARATVRALEQEKKQLRQETGIKRRPKRTTKLGQQLLDLDYAAPCPASMSTPQATPGPSTVTTGFPTTSNAPPPLPHNPEFTNVHSVPQPAILPGTWASPGLTGDGLGGSSSSGGPGSYSFEWPFLGSQFEFNDNTYLRGL